MSPSPSFAGRRHRAASVAAAVVAAAALLLSPVPAVAAPTGSANPAAVSADVPRAGSSITVSADRVVEGQAVEVTWSTDQPAETNWIGVYPAAVGDPDGDPGSTQWVYTPGTSGTHTFTGLPAGTWRVYLLADDGYAQLAPAAEVTVVADTAQPQPGDPAAPVEIEPVVTDFATDGVLVREGFADDVLPEGWTVATGAGADVPYGAWTATTRSAWTAEVDGMRARFARPLGGLLVADAEQFGGALETTLTSAPVAVDDLAAVRLTFDSHYRGAPGQEALVHASFDGGAPREVLRLDSTTVADGYDARQMNYAQDVVVEVPAGAEEVVFSWEFRAGDEARYWAIDAVAVHAVQRPASGTPTQAWVMSDIQGHPADWQHAIGDYAEIAPDADSMLIVGDIVNSGTVREWDEIYAVMDATADVRPRQTVAAIGNHERYAAGGFAANRDRFLAFAERDRVWDEYTVAGPAGELPVIVLGQEFASPSDVAMSDPQVAFLEERLAHWTALDKQVVVITHFPLGDTVSASWIPWYHDHHQMNDRLTSILGNYPNAIVFTGHTHYPAELGDWAVQRRTADGHADGFWAVNTTAMHIEWDARGESTDGISEVQTRDVNRGLTLDAYGDRVVVTAYDFFSDEQLRQVTIPNPLVPFDRELAPTDPGTDPGTDPTDPGTDPTDPGTDPTDPGTDPTDPGTDPTDPGTDPTDPTDPGTDPTDPGTDPTDPGTDPTDPTDPGTDPTDPGTDPTDPATPGAPTAADLTTELRDVITVSDADGLRPGGTVTVTVPTAWAGQVVEGWLFSEPMRLGSATVAASGTVAFTLPADVPAGAHRLAVTDADGRVLGWAAVTVTTPERIAATGGELPWALALGGAGLLVAGGLVLALRRRTTTG